MTDHLEAIENAITPHGGYVELMGGNCEGIRFNIANGDYAIITFGDNQAEGDPAAYEWTVGLYNKNDSDIDQHGDVTLDAALFYVRLWREAALSN